MASQTVTHLLGTLSRDPDNQEALEGLNELLDNGNPEQLGAESVSLLDSARKEHNRRAEYHVVARLLEVEARLSREDPDRAADLLKELGRIYREELLDDDQAKGALERALELRPGDDDIQEAIESIDQAAEKWSDIAQRFIEEAENASDDHLRTSLLVSAASLIWKYKKRGREKQVDSLFKKALSATEGDSRAARLYEQILRRRDKHDELAQVLLNAAEYAKDKEERLNFYVRAARVMVRELGDAARAAASYERVLDLSPGHREAMTYLVEHFTERQQWDHLVNLYETALRSRTRLEDEQGALMQLGMVHWKYRDAPDEAEPHFARLRKIEPAHQSVLEFFRAHWAEREPSRWVGVLADAQRSTRDPELKLSLGVELAKAAQSAGGSDERAIDAWKAVLRLEPKHEEAPDALKTLYERTEKWNALVELLKGEAEAVPASDPAKKATLLRGLIPIYRDRLGLDAMVINTYNAVLQLQPGDTEALSSLAQTYESGGRWNDLIQVLSRKADASEDTEEQVALLMRVATLWIDRFANYNQATRPLEKVIALQPDNRDALGRLKGIYQKKRAWKHLFEILTKESELASDPAEQLAHKLELAKLAGERLHRHADAIGLWKEVLEQDPARSEAVDALLKLSEREKDWATLASALERKIERVEEKKASIKLLQKLGGIYGDHLDDPAKAAETWKRILALDPKNGRALRTLRETFMKAGDWAGMEELYAEANDWEGLVEVLGHAAERVEDKDTKVKLSFRAAEIYEEKLEQPHRAFRSYERVLSLIPDDPRAAASLVPIYERDEKWSRLPSLYEVLLAGLAEDAVEERVAMLGKLRALCAERLSDHPAAFDYAVRAFAYAPTDADVRSALEDATDKAERYEDAANAYKTRLEAVQEDGERLWLRRQIARIAGEHLGQTDVSIEQLLEILEADPSDRDSAATLERIFRREGRSEELRSLLEKRLEHVTSDEDRVGYLLSLASLEEDVLEDAESASKRYRAIVELEPSHREALKALDRLTEASESWEEHAEILERLAELTEERADRLALSLRLGELWVGKLNQPRRAVGAFAELLDADPRDEKGVRGLERVAELDPKLMTEVGPLLETAYEAAESWEKLANAVKARLSVTEEREEKRALLLRYADLCAERVGDTDTAYQALEDAFLADPSDVALWDRLWEAADVAGRHEALAKAFAKGLAAERLSEVDQAQLASKVAQLYDEALGTPHEAEPFHARVLKHDPLDERAFEALKELYTNEERWEDLQRLYRARIDESMEQDAKLDLLLQVCFLFEELIDDPEQAIVAYQDVLELEPDHGSSRRALERLYERTERWDEMVQLLRRELDEAKSDEHVGLTYRLGALFETRLAQPLAAVDQYEQVLSLESNHKQAREALERMMASSDQRHRIAQLLEPVYEERADWPELVGVLTIQLEDLQAPGPRLDMLMRIAELQENRIHDPSQAFLSVAKAVEVDPSDTTVREQLARLAQMRGAEAERADVLERVIAAATESPSLRSELLTELALLWDERVGDPEKAEGVYQRLIEAEPDNAEVVLRASKALERIHIGSANHRALAEDLTRQVAFEDDSARADLLSRLGDLYENVLEEPKNAIGVHKQRLEHDPSDIDAMKSLERLYESESMWADVVEVLRKREEASFDADEQRAILGRIAGLYEEKLEDRDQAIATLSDVLDRFGREEDTLKSLCRLYEQTERWTDLLEVLEMRFEVTESDEERAAVRFQMAELRRTKTEEYDEAIDAYAEVLELAPDHQGARDSLTRMTKKAGEGEADAATFPVQVRVKAARVLVPVFEQTAAYEALLAALTVVAESDAPEEKFSALRRAAEVADGGLDDAHTAFDLLGRAIEAGLSEPDLDEMFRDFQRVASASERWSDYVASLRGWVPDLVDHDLLVHTLYSIASTAEKRLEDTALARDYYQRVIEQAPEHSDALDALEALTEAAQDHRALLDILRRKTELAASAEQRVTFLLRRAVICDEHLDDLDNAIECFEQALVDGEPKEAYDGLERLYRRAERFSDLATHYERMLEARIGEAVRVRHELGKVQRDHLDDPWGAIDQFRETLALDSTHEPTVQALESMMDDQERRATVAEILEPVFLQAMKWPKVTVCLEARLDAEDDVDKRKALLTRLGQMHEDYLEDLDGALAAYARLFREDPRDETTWETLFRLAKVLERWERLAQIYDEALAEIGSDDEATAKLALSAGRLHDTRTGNLERASQLYARALVFEPSDSEAFDLLSSVLTRRQAWPELLDLYREQANLAEDDAARIALLHKSATILVEKLNEPDRAVETYRDVLLIDRVDQAATRALDELLTKQERWTDLAEHLRSQIDLNEGTAESLDLKFRLAGLLSDKLNDTFAAIDTYEEITQATPHHEATVSALEALVVKPEYQRRIIELLEPIYLQTDQWRKRIAIYEAQTQSEDDAAESVRLLSLIADLHENRANDQRRAFDAWVRALGHEPHNETARGHVDRLAEQLEAWDGLIAAYEGALLATDDTVLRASLLYTMAQVHDERRGDPRAAITTYERLADNDPEDARPLDSLEALHTMVGDWRGLVDVQRRKVDRSYDPQERGDLYKRAGSVLEELLGDKRGAVEAYSAALVEEDRDPVALEALDRLYEQLDDHVPLADILRRRVELEEEAETRVEVGLRLGRLEEERLRQAHEAIDAYQKVLEDSPGEPEAVGALARLYERQAMWPELLDNLKQQAAAATENDEKVKLLHRAGEVLEREMDDVLGALPLYEEVLGLHSTHEPSIQALIRVSNLEEYREQAAEILEPRLRASCRWDELAELLSAKAASTLDPADKVVELKRLAEVHEGGRRDLDAAFEAYKRALTEEPGDEAAAGELERLAEMLGAWDRAADAFAGRASSVLEPEIARSLYGRLARIAEERLGDDARAIEAFTRATESAGDDEQALGALDRLYLKTQSWPELCEILERRVQANLEPTKRVELLVRLGQLKKDELGDLQGAFRAFSEVLDTDPTEPRAVMAMEALAEDEFLAQDVIEVLDAVYRQTGAKEKVAALYDIRVELADTDGERVPLLQEQAGVFEQDLGDTSRALATLRRAFTLDPRDEGLLTELERLADAAKGWASLRGLVEAIVDGDDADRTLARELNLHAARWYRDQLEDAAAAEARLRAAIAAEADTKEAHEQLVALLRADASRADELVTALVHWAEIEYDDESKKQRLREAAQIARGTLADAARSRSCYEQVLEVDAQDAQALDALVELAEEAEDYSGVAGLLGRRIEAEFEVTSRLQLRKRLARLYAERLESIDDAIDTWRAALEEDPTDLSCIEALEQLYEQTKRFDELEEQIQRRLDIAETPADRIAARVRLARLAESTERREDAIEQLKEILEDDPSNVEALTDLERLYRADERWDELVSLLQSQADDATQAQVELDALVRLGSVHVEQLGDAERAVAIYRRVLDREPKHIGALTALCELHSQRQEWSDAADVLERLAQIQPKVDAAASYLQLATLAAERLDEAERAERALLRAVELDENSREAKAALQAHYAASEQHEKLVELLKAERNAAKETTDQMGLLKQIADLYAEKLSDPGTAASFLEEAVKLVPDDREVLLPLCDFYIAAGRQQDAVPVLERIIASYGSRRSKEIAVYHHRLGRAKESMGDLDGAMASYDSAFKIDLTNVQVLSDLGRLCIQRDDLDRAQKTFRALLLQKLAPEHGITKADVYFHLGEISAKKGDTKKATSMLQRAVAEDAGHQAARDLLAELNG